MKLGEILVETVVLRPSDLAHAVEAAYGSGSANGWSTSGS